MTDTTLATDKLIQDHFEPPSQEDLEGVPQPSFSQTSDLIHPANNLTEPGLDPSDEIISERTERTKTYLLDEEEGRYRTIGSIPKAHYRDNPDDPDEKLKELDMTIEEQNDRFHLKQEDGSSNAPYELEAFKGQIGYGVAHKGGGEVHLTLEEIGNQKITPNFLFARADTTVVGNLIEWNIRGLGISIRLIARPEKVEIFKTIKNETAPRKFKWTVSESKSDDARFTFNPHGAYGNDNNGNELELNEKRNIVKEDDQFEYSEYTEEFTGRSAQIDDPKTRSRSWQSAEYPVEIDPSTSKDITANIDDVTVGTDGDFNSDSVYGGAITAFPRYFYAGLRFRSLGISQGVTITKATLQAYVDGTYDGGNTLPMYGDDVDDAPQWSSNDAPYDITKTSNSANWVLTSVSTSETLQITSIVQEIISRSGWSSSNAIRLANGKVTPNGTARFSDYSDSSPDVATLSVTWSSPASPITVSAPVESTSSADNTPSISGTATVSPFAETLDAIGNTPTTTASASTISIPVESLNANEIFPGVSAPATAGPSPETISASDVIPVVSAAATAANPPVETASSTDNPPAISGPYNISTPVESIGSNENFPSINASAASISAIVEALTGSDNTPGISGAYSVSAFVEQITSSDLVPTASASASTVSPFVATITGSNPSPGISAAATVSAFVETIGSSDLEPAVFIQKIVNAPVEVITLSDLFPSLASAPAVITSPVETISSTEKTPGISGAYSVTPSPETVTLNDLFPSIESSSAIITPGVEQTTLSDLFPGASAGSAIIAPGSDLITTNDLEIQISAATVISANNEKITLSDLFPGIAASASVISPQNKTLNLTAPIMQVEGKAVIGPSIEVITVSEINPEAGFFVVRRVVTTGNSGNKASDISRGNDVKPI